MPVPVMRMARLFFPIFILKISMGLHFKIQKRGNFSFSVFHSKILNRKTDEKSARFLRKSEPGITSISSPFAHLFFGPILQLSDMYGVQSTELTVTTLMLAD
jgi:hypothetical protein